MDSSASPATGKNNLLNMSHVGLGEYRKVCETENLAFFQITKVIGHQPRSITRDLSESFW